MPPADSTGCACREAATCAGQTPQLPELLGQARYRWEGQLARRHKKWTQLPSLQPKRGRRLPMLKCRGAAHILQTCSLLVSCKEPFCRAFGLPTDCCWAPGTW